MGLAKESPGQMSPFALLHTLRPPSCLRLYSDPLYFPYFGFQGYCLCAASHLSDQVPFTFYIHEFHIKTSICGPCGSLSYQV